MAPGCLPRRGLLLLLAAASLSAPCAAQSTSSGGGREPEGQAAAAPGELLQQQKQQAAGGADVGVQDREGALKKHRGDALNRMMGLFVATRETLKSPQAQPLLNQVRAVAAGQGPPTMAELARAASAAVAGGAGRSSPTGSRPPREGRGRPPREGRGGRRLRRLRQRHRAGRHGDGDDERAKPSGAGEPDPVVHHQDDVPRPVMNTQPKPPKYWAESENTCPNSRIKKLKREILGGGYFAADAEIATVQCCPNSPGHDSAPKGCIYKFGDVCYLGRNYTHDDAEKICKSKGERLCTKKEMRELKMNETCCDFPGCSVMLSPTPPTWTSTVDEESMNEWLTRRIDYLQGHNLKLFRDRLVWEEAVDRVKNELHDHGIVFLPQQPRDHDPVQTIKVEDTDDDIISRNRNLTIAYDTLKAENELLRQRVVDAMAWSHTAKIVPPSWFNEKRKGQNSSEYGLENLAKTWKEPPEHWKDKEKADEYLVNKYSDEKSSDPPNVHWSDTPDGAPTPAARHEWLPQPEPTGQHEVAQEAQHKEEANPRHRVR